MGHTSRGHAKTVRPLISLSYIITIERHARANSADFIYLVKSSVGFINQSEKFVAAKIDKTSVVFCFANTHLRLAVCFFFKRWRSSFFFLSLFFFNDTYTRTTLLYLGTDDPRSRRVVRYIFFLLLLHPFSLFCFS